MRYKKMKKVMKNKKISEEELSRLTGISFEQLNKKLSGEMEFTLWEIKSISKALSLKGFEIIHIFFDEKVS